MKKHQSYWFLLVGILLSGMVHAEVNNYVGAYGQIGEWSLMPQNSKYSLSMGVNGGVGFQYELQSGNVHSKTRFLFDVGLGAWGGYSSFMQSTKQDLLSIDNQLDLNNDPFTYVYDIHDRKDGYSNIAVQIPLMVGVQHKKFYMLAGVKVGYNVASKAHVSALVTTYGKYADIPNIYNIPEYQFFTDYQKQQTARATSYKNLSLDVSLEMGGRVGFLTYDKGFDVPKRLIEYRLAAFVDYGVLDIHNRYATGDAVTKATKYETNPSSDRYVYKSTSMLDGEGGLTFNDMMSTTNFADWVNSLTVGIKFTVLFQLPKAGTCVLCQDNYMNMSSPSSGGGSMKYEE